MKKQSDINVDTYVGRRIRSRREERGLSQQALGDWLGVSFQQVQKYEWGKNRISASKLYLCANRLGVTVQYFFEGYSNASDAILPEKSLSREHLELARMLSEVKNKDLRIRVIRLLQAIIDTSKETELP